MINRLEIDGLLLLEPKRHGDERGVFTELFKASELAEAGFSRPFIQDNLARSSQKGVVRGLHMQRPPHAQDKLVRVSRGAILDVAVDLRPGSDTFGRAYAVVLSATNWLQLLVPAGFAHGYCTLEEDCEVLYKVTAAYAPDHEEGLLWSDPAIDVAWPVAPGAAVLNDRDRSWPTLAEWTALKGLTNSGPAGQRDG